MIERIGMMELIRNSNLVEGIDDPAEDRRSLRAWNWLQKLDVVSLADLFELHRRITLKQLRVSERGQFRRIQVYVGNHVPPAPVIAQIQAIEWLTDVIQHWRTLDPKEMHVRFETIHPFVDGNGRTGRMLMWWHEVKLGRKPTLIEVENRQAYYKWFTEARGQ